MATLASIKYGMPVVGAAAPASPVGAGASNGAVTVQHGGGLLDSPVAWLVGLAGVTLGLIGASTSARVGPIRASVSAGKA